LESGIGFLGTVPEDAGSQLRARGQGGETRGGFAGRFGRCCLEFEVPHTKLPRNLSELQIRRATLNPRQLGLIMRLLVIAIGRLKQGPERELAERYRERFDDIGRKLGFRGLEIQEIAESRARDPVSRIAEEAAAVSAAMLPKSVLVALDERGDNIESGTFARHLARWRDDQVANTIFSIGGADGLSPELRRMAQMRMAFGSATWPHQMVRVMLLEQIYRAATILAGHPYHRA
jgi:23S rRNA (pseudouridine1915-N3)-methyltransferase